MAFVKCSGMSVSQNCNETTQIISARSLATILLHMFISYTWHSPSNQNTAKLHNTRHFIPDVVDLLKVVNINESVRKHNENKQPSLILYLENFKRHYSA